MVACPHCGDAGALGGACDFWPKLGAGAVYLHTILKYVYKKKRYQLLAGLADALGYPLFSLWPRKAPPAPDRRTILLIRLDHLGDTLYSTAAPKLLKERFPQARVLCLVSSYAAPLFEKNPFVDETWIYDASWFS